MYINQRPYVILNGVNSQTIQGLLISKLAAISKPEQRVRNEVIDGRDGDICTPLGFAAYDKVITIGLTYNYNIDDVIEFFNSEGTVIFSNEPDKYYRYRINSKIDFNKLINFKQATVTFHCQPFKFSVSELTKTFAFTNATSGSFVIRNNGNIYSRPTIIINGSGTINISLNGAQILVVDMSTISTIIINLEQMNAYSSSGTLLNRKVTGDYDKIQLRKGENTISFMGSVTQIQIENYSRWL